MINHDRLCPREILNALVCQMYGQLNFSPSKMPAGLWLHDIGVR